MTENADPLAGLPEIARAVITRRALAGEGLGGFEALLEAVAEAPGATAEDIRMLVMAWLRGPLPSNDQPLVPTVDQPMKVAPGFHATLEARRAATGYLMPHKALEKELKTLDALLEEVLAPVGPLPHDEAALLLNLLSGSTMSPENTDSRLRHRRLAETLREEREHGYFDAAVADRLIERIEAQPSMYDYALERAAILWLAQDAPEGSRGPFAELTS
jgi:hypothetical protein